MSDNKKYYYLKFKDNYFEQDNIKIIEAMENGYIYSLIILKLYLKSCKHNGCLMMTERIPYNPKNLEILAKVLNHDISHLRDTIKIAVEFDLITILDSKQIWMTDIQNFIGHSSSEADRKRLYRAKMEGALTVMDKCPDKRKDKTPPEKELKKEKDIKRFTKPTKQQLLLFCKEINYDLDIDYWLDNYNGNGWLVGKDKKMKDWKATVRNWQRRNFDQGKAKKKSLKRGVDYEIIEDEDLTPDEIRERVKNAQ